MAIVPPVAQPDYTTSPARFVETATGKQILLRGVNVQMDAATSTVNMIDTLGCNFVRIACFWDQIETTAPTGSGSDFTTYTHNYNATALGQIDNLVAHCAGLTVQGNPVMCQIDFHQAGWSPFFAGFSGVPSWYYNDSRFPGSNWSTSQKSSAIAAWWTTELNASQTLYIAFARMMVARYSQHANVVMYNSFNEPNAGGLSGTSRAKTTTMHTWLAPVVQAMSAADAGGAGVAPMRGISVMNRGGGEGYGDADFSPFGTQAQMQAMNMVLESHMYYVGLRPGYPATLSTDFGLNSAGDDYLPSSTAAHINLSPGYVGQQQYQANFHSVYKTAAATLGLPWFHGEWGVNFDDSGWSAYQSQMQSYFDANRVSCTRWLLAPVSGPGSLNLIQSGALTGTGRALQTWFQGTTFTIGGTTTVPVNTAAPTLNDDTPQVNEQLLCSPGSWSGNPAPTLTYQWQTASVSGGPFANLTGSTASTYTVPSAQLGKFLRCQVTGTNSAGNSTANSEVAAAVAAAGTTVPVNTTAPVQTDSTRNQPATSGVIAGDILSTTDGTWSNLPTSFSYQWQSQAPDGGISNVSGDSATPSQYDTTLADVGNQIRCQVTATNGSGGGVPAITAWSNAILAPATQNALIFYTSDNGNGANQAHAISNLSNVPLTGSGVDLVVNGGDTYAIGKAADFTADIPPVYGPSGRNVYPIYLHTIGNHDWDNAAAGFDAFYAGKGTRAFISPHYGRIDLAGWTLLFLNGYQAKTQTAGTTTPAPDSSAGVGATQLSWLQNNLPGGTNNLNGNHKQCIVFCHNMRWSCSQNHGDNANLDNVWRAIQGKAVAWVHGHAHNLSMQRQRDGAGAVAVDASDGTPTGVYDICAGAGGEGNYAQNTGYTPSPLFFRGNATTPQFGYLLIRINGNAATFEFHDQNSNFSGAALFTKTLLGSPTAVVQQQPPVNTSPPTISDTTPAVQETLAANVGTWTGTAPITYTQTWQISQDGGFTWGPGTGVTSGGNYTVGTGDVGFPIRARVTASNVAGRVDAVSAATAAVAGTTPTVPVLVSPPIVTPTNPSVGTQVSTTDGVWLNNPTSFTYQWQERDAVGNTTTIVGETTPIYVVQTSDVGMALSCVVTAVNADGSSTPTASNTTVTVTQVVPGQLTVNITDPPAGATVTTTLIGVTVDAEDTDGIQSVEVRALKTDGTWTGAWVQAFGAYPLFSAQLALAGGDGQYEVDARATANPPAA